MPTALRSAAALPFQCQSQETFAYGWFRRIVHLSREVGLMAQEQNACL